MELGDLQLAREDWEKALELGDKNAAELLKQSADLSFQKKNENIDFKSIADKKYTAGDFSGAIDNYSKALKINPSNVNAYISRGNCKDNNGDLQGAIEDYNKSLEIDSNNALAYYNRGYAKKSSGDQLGAIDDYNNALQFINDNAEIYNARGIAKKEINQYKEAICDFDKATEIDPSSIFPYVNRASIRLILKDFNAAIND